MRLKHVAKHKARIIIRDKHRVLRPGQTFDLDELDGPKSIKGRLVFKKLDKSALEILVDKLIRRIEKLEEEEP